MSAPAGNVPPSPRITMALAPSDFAFLTPLRSPDRTALLRPFTGGFDAVTIATPFFRAYLDILPSLAEMQSPSARKQKPRTKNQAQAQMLTPSSTSKNMG
mmetsp:Transcript_12976/g.25169  ORF Transcript_12976/g.25169 Transcript_12976/m.25169 type:complete len:100 (+) Transcript_12976:2050-2349(+)